MTKEQAAVKAQAGVKSPQRKAAEWDKQAEEKGAESQALDGALSASLYHQLPHRAEPSLGAQCLVTGLPNKWKTLCSLG